MARLRWRGLHALGIDRPSTWSWLMWTGIVSLSLNIFWISWVMVHRQPATVFTAWEKLHDLALVDADALRDTHPLQGPGNVIATSFFTDEFATAIATLGHSLDRVNTTARRLMLYIPEQVSPRGLCLASATGFQPHPVDRIAPPDDGRGVYRHFIDQYTKLRLWELEEVGARGVVYLDADTLVTRNFDELFALPYAFAATPDVYTNRKGFVVQFNAGVLFLRPRAALFRDIVKTIATAKYWRHEAEQALLNTFYAKDVVRLPYAYNANLAIKARSPRMWEGIKHDIRIIHYTMVKPFTRDNKNYALVPMSELEANARRRGKSEFGGMRKSSRTACCSRTSQGTSRCEGVVISLLWADASSAGWAFMDALYCRCLR